jgi:threonine 3-dehydrogenase
MKAVVKVKAAAGREGTRIMDVPVPRPGRGEVLIKVLACGICGSDRHIYNGTGGMQEHMPIPVTYGHEFCGEVTELGEAVEHLKPGQYVSAEMHVACGVCRACRSGSSHVCERTKILGVDGTGSYAEFIAVPAANVMALPANIPPKVGAFLDALGNAVHTVFEFPFAGRNAAVTGYGPIGAMASAVGQFAGAAQIHVFEVAEFAVEHARRWAREKGLANVHVHHTRGAEAHEEALRRAREMAGGGMDVVWEMSGNPQAINDAFGLARHGGSVVLLGIPKESAVTVEHYSRDFIYKGLAVKGILGRRLYDTWIRMLGLLEAGLDVTHIVTHEFEGLESFHEAVETFNQHRSLKVVIYPHGKPKA